MLYFQPQVTRAGRVLGAEVPLIRRQHPDAAAVAPLEFILSPKKATLINQIAVVLRTARSQLAGGRLALETAQLQLAVNVSARQFRRADFRPRSMMFIVETATS